MESSKKCELEITEDELDEIQVTINDIQENLDSAIKDINDTKSALEKEKNDFEKTLGLVTHVKDQLEKWLQASMEAQKSKAEKCTLTPQKIFMEFSEKYEDKKTVINGLQGIGKGFFSPIPFFMLFGLVTFDLFYFDIFFPLIPKTIQVILAEVIMLLLFIIISNIKKNYNEEKKKKFDRTLNFISFIVVLVSLYVLALIFQISFPEIRTKILNKFSCVAIAYINGITICLIIFESIREMNLFFTEDEEKKAEEEINKVLKNHTKNIYLLSMIIDSINAFEGDIMKTIQNSSLYFIISTFGFFAFLSKVLNWFGTNTIEEKLNLLFLFLLGVDIFCFLSKRNGRKKDLFISVLNKIRYDRVLSKKDYQ